MHNVEWSLVIFTFLVQLSVGFYAALAVINLVTNRKFCCEAVDLLWEHSISFATILALIAAVISFFHLGSPLKAFYSILNIADSWISREIAFLLLFILASMFLTLLYYRKINPIHLKCIMGWGIVLIGVLLLIAMSKIYMLPTIPSWNSLTTPLTVFSTTFILGMLITFSFQYYQLLILSKNKLVKRDETFTRKFLKFVVMTGLLVMTIEIAINIWQAVNYVNVMTAVTGDEFTTANGMIWYLRLKIIFTFTGILILVHAYNKGIKRKMKSVDKWIYVGILLLFMSEFLGRAFFYSTYFQNGLS